MKDITIVGKDKFYKLGTNPKLFYHASVNKYFDISSIQIYKENSDSIGFFIYDEFGYKKSIDETINKNYQDDTNKGIAKITLSDNLYIYPVPVDTISKLTKEQLRELKNQGYDLIKGEESSTIKYILLNKGKVLAVDYLSIEDSLEYLNNNELEEIKEKINSNKTK